VESGRFAARAFVVVIGAVGLLAVATTARAADALVDLLDGATLEQAAPSTACAPSQALALLLVHVVRERIAAGALAYSTDVPVVAVGGDPGVSLAAHARLPIGELLQLVLLAQSRSAIATLAAAVGPGWERARARLRRAATRLTLHGTIIPDEWPGEAPPTTAARRPLRARSTIGDVARLAAAVAGDGEIRRRLALDGAPIANGGLIVRATDPLIGRTAAVRSTTPSTHAGLLGSDPPAAIAIGERDGLILLAVATGAEPAQNAARLIDDAFTRYRRVELVRVGQAIGGNVVGPDGAVMHVSAAAARPFAMTVPRAGAFAIDAWLQLRAPTDAPLRPTQRIGELVFGTTAKIVGTVPLVAESRTGAGGWLDTASR
jgi:hypothetical protein